MSGQNIERHRQFADAFNSRDIEALVALCDPDVEWHSHFAAADLGEQGVYHGHDGLREWHRSLSEVWGDQVRVEIEAYFDFGEQTLASYALQGRGQQSGAEVAMPAAGLVRWRDGLIVYFKGYRQIEDVFRDLGVSEETLEPIAP
jgi:ketosteroid isomerase-like protein